MTWFGTRISVPLPNKIWLFTVSNAFEKSKKRPQDMRLLVNRGLEIISDLHDRFLSRMCIAEGSFQLVGLLHFKNYRWMWQKQ